MMSYLTRPNRVFPTTKKEPTEADLDKKDLKPSGDILRNFLIEEMKARDLDADEIRYLMETKPRDNVKTQKISDSGQRILTKPIKPNTQVKPFKQNSIKPNTQVKPLKVDLKIDPSPIVLPPKVEVKRSEEDERFLKKLEEYEKEKQRIKNGGLAYLMGGAEK